MNRVFFATFFAIVAVFGVFGTSMTQAGTITTKQNQIDAINKKIKAYKDMVALKQKEQDYLSSQIQNLDAQSHQLESSITDKQTLINNLDNQIVLIEGKVSEKTVLIDQQKKILGELLRTYYAQKGSLDVTTSDAFFVSPSDQINADARTNEWTGDVSGKVTELSDSIISLRQSLVESQKKLRDDRNRVESTRFQLEQQTKYLDATKQKQAVVLQTSKITEKKYTGIISDLQQQRDDIEQEIQTLEQAKVGQLDLSTLPKFGTSLFIFPVAKPNQSQGYGKTTFAKTAYSSAFHNGLDFADSVGTPIYAAGAGTVIGVGDCGKYAYGKWIAIDHGNGLVTLYGHLSKQIAAKGQTVTQGKQIGLMGSTGYSTGSHVHFTVFAKNSYEVIESTKVSSLMIPTGATVNPKNYLP
jgi:murein DD-endopeptidase MepM/ murein hydrolase activator NlpD